MIDTRDDFARTVAAYRRYDVLLVNPVKDGLNLVAKEGPIVNERDGVLCLSPDAGAWDELSPGAIAVHPFDVTQTASQLHRALTMDELGASPTGGRTPEDRGEAEDRATGSRISSRQRERGNGVGEIAEQIREALGAFHDDVGQLQQFLRRLRRPDRDAHRFGLFDPKRSEVTVVVARERETRRSGFRR